jgi:hypothetical protein
MPANGRCDLTFKNRAFYTAARESSSNNRTGLEDATETTPHGDQSLHVQWWEAPDDGHGGVRNMLSNVE